MKIKEIGGEFGLIDRLAGIVSGDCSEVIRGIGDDAAVIRIAPEPAPYLLVTTDLLVEERHFRRDWYRPEQVGIKASECNVSDIAAMGGRPQWMFASLTLPTETEVEWIEALYSGIAASCRRHAILLLGGDTTHGPVVSIGITLLGSVAPENLCLRSAARPGDQLMVTGPLGGSAAGMAMLQAGKTIPPYLRQKHLEPQARMDAVDTLAPLANAMIDISDGLGAEVRHICAQSKVGAEIDAAAIPLHATVVQAARLLDVDPLMWALDGGEDFELLFSVSPEMLPRLQRSGLEYYRVGRITDQADSIVLLAPHAAARPLAGGYDHFR